MSSVTDNISEIEQQILDAVGDLENDVPRELSKLASQIAADLKGGNYKNRTGALRRSIQVALIDKSNIVVSMLPYGYFISFGVEGGKYKALGLPDEVAAAFGTRKFKSRKRKAWGIRPRGFYPEDIEERIIEILNEA